MKTDKSSNPIAALEHLWDVAERIALFSAFIVVSGTLGYVSLHMLA